MRAFIEFMAARNALANVFTYLLIILGLSALTVIQRDNFPRVEFDQMTVTTRYLGASPEDVELNVTNKIETSLKQVDGLKKVVSFSMENISTVHITLDPDLPDKTKIKNAVRDAVARISDLPVELDEKPVVKAATAANFFPIIEIGITGSQEYGELREVARQLERDLLDIAGVASVTKYGYLEREIKIEVDPEAVEKWQISTAEIAKAIGQRNIRSSGGSFESFTSDKNILTLAQFENPKDVEDVIVHRFEDGSFVRVHDLAVINDDYEPEKVLTRMNGKSAISFVVYKKESADIIRTVDRMKDFIEKNQHFLPAGVAVEFSNDASRLVRNRIDIVLSNGVIGLLLVLIVLGIFLDRRSAFWVAISLPVTLLGTLFLLPMFNVYLDSIALAAMILVIGIIVDDGIVVAESIWSRRELGMTPLEAAVDGVVAVIWPVLATILTTILAFAPMFFMPGMMGDFIYVIPLVIVLALVISFIEVVMVLPAHLTQGARLIALRPMDSKTRFERFQEVFSGMIEAILPWRYLIIVLFVATLVGALWYAGRYMDFVLFPSESADNFEIYIELPSGASLDATSNKVKELEVLIGAMPDTNVDSFVTRIGNHGVLGSGENENWAYIGVYLTPHSTRSNTADAIVDKLRTQAEQIEGIAELRFQILSGGPPVGRPITLRVAGDDDELRSGLASLVVERLEQIEGVADVGRDDKRGKEQVKINLDFIRLADVGLSVADVANHVRLAYDGQVITSVRYNGEDVDFRVIMAESARESLDSLANLMLPLPDAPFIRLNEVAMLESEPGLSSYFHFDYTRTITVTADVVKTLTTPLKAIEQLMSGLDLKRDWPGMRIVVGGEAEETESSMGSLIVAFTAAAIGIYLLLYLLFNSFLQPLSVLIAVPFSLVGVIIAFALHHQPLGFLAMLGVVGLSGIVVNDSLILVDVINKLKADQPGDPWLAAIAEAVGKRLRPILLTSITTVAGLLPMAYGIGGSDPYTAPMALAMGYGLLFSTVLTLIFLPCLVMVGVDLQSFGGVIGRLFVKRRRG